MYLSDLKHANHSLEQKLQTLYGLSRGGGIKLALRPAYLDLLRALGNPHQNLPPVIHVAGTNGKGSVIAMLRAMLQAGGYKVHAYTSPHLQKFNERIVLAGHEIADDFLESLIDETLAANNGADVTFFEITTALAFAAFARAEADILLLETGLGGRFDCTNVIDKPLTTIITAIGLDHVEYLGDTYGKIAYEKAGIMKRGVSCIISKQSGEAMPNDVLQTLESAAAQTGAPLIRAGAEWFTETKQNQIHFVFNHGGESVERILPLPNLKGLHQGDNAGAALAALQVIRDQFPVSDEAIETGLRNINWPARLQNITAFFDDILPPGWEIFLDGGHNDNAAAALSTQARSWTENGQPLYLVLGMMGHKDPSVFLKPLLPFLSGIAVTAIPGEPLSLAPARLAQALKDINLPLSDHEGFLPALQALTQKPGPARILIAGSLYLAGHVLNYGARNAHNA